MLDVYGVHLTLRGIHETPAFGRPSRRREDLVDAVWKESSRVADVLAAGVTDPGILQLSAVGDLAFLDVDPDAATLTRFAPRAARGALGRARPGDTPGAPSPALPALPAELVWTDGGQVAGVLRLAGLRAGATHTSREDRS
jgi:hypothetical protein